MAHATGAFQRRARSTLSPKPFSTTARRPRFTGNREIPAIYLINSDGSESLVPKDVRGELVVVHATAREFRLRKGNNVLCIFNEAFDAVGINPGTNTTSPSIERRAKKSPPTLKPR